MKNSKVTKRSLFSSVMSLLLCVSMLIGTTFAWFTDTATTAVNKVQAGKLDVTLVNESEESVEGKTLKWKTVDSEVLWEPGATYELETVKVKNNGNLALKYKVIISGINGDAELNKAIDWTINNADANTEYKLAAGESMDITISGTMKTTAGNEYQDKQIDGISITVLATQDTVENDSKGNQYDKFASYPDVDAEYYVTPDNAQTTIDNAVDNSVVILQSGTYSELYLGQVKRTINNLTIIAEDGVKVQGMEAVVAGTQQLKINNLTLKNINFIKKGVQFDLNNKPNTNGTPWIFVDGFTMTDCTYDGTEYVLNDPTDTNQIGNRLFDIATDAPGSHQFKNVLIEDCTVNKAQQGIRIGGVTDITVRDCTFENTAHNAITLRSVSGGINRIEDNTITNGEDRAFRIGAHSGGTTIYKNNVITNTGDIKDGTNFKVNYLDSKNGILIKGDIEFIGNTVNGREWNSDDEVWG